MPIAACLTTLRAQPHGLTSADARERLARLGPNLLAPPSERALLLRFLARFQNPLVLLLLAASAVAGVTGDAASLSITAGIAILSVTLDFVQEHRAGQAAERLRRSVEIRVRVVRDGAETTQPAADLVPGDLVLLSAGDLVPADVRVLEAKDFFVNQAMLTGEPYPVEKHAVAEPATASTPAEAVHLAFLGTSVISGSSKSVVVLTGSATTLGSMGAELQKTPPPTSFELGTRHFGLLVMRIAVILVGFVLLVEALRGHPWLEAFLFATALAVGLTPELLPMIVSVTLAHGARRLAQRKVLVKRLGAILDLGSMDVLCTDKTGTLTEARIRLERHVDAEGRDSPRVLQLAYLNSRFESGLRSPLDDAILRHEEVDIRGWSKLDEVPFDFERRRVSVLLAYEDGTRRLVVKGAVEDVLRLSTQVEVGGAQRPLDAAGHALLVARSDDLARQGFRVLGIASKSVAAGLEHAAVGDEVDLAFAGFAAFEDPPKASAAKALQALRSSGVEVKVVTGDNELVAEHVCRELGLQVQGVLLGQQIQVLDDSALAAQALTTTLFCRVTPQQKSRVIQALRSRGRVVGYLGDGLNDALPLHVADVGLSVDSAVDVAKDAADLILLEHDLQVLHDGVLEGRRTFANIMKYVVMATSSNFGNMLSMAAASMLLPFLPLLPVQVLLNNFLYDLSELAIPGDSVDPEDVARPHRWDMGLIHRYMVILGSVSSVFDLLTFAVLLRMFRANAVLFHTGWFVESMVSQVLVIFVLRTRGSPLHSRPSPLLLATSLGVIALALALPWSPVARMLGFTPLPTAYLGVLAVLVVGYVATVWGVRTAFHRRLAGA